jgi:pyridoxamine 5'-phosphate oxidase
MNKDDLDTVLADIWDRLANGARDRRSAFHTPVVASVDVAGAPQQRVMVMRAADAEKRQLRFHTDVRTPKITQLEKNSAVSVLGYDPAAKVQIRVSGIGRIEQDTDLADAAWDASAPSSRRCYLAEAGPSSESAHPTSGLPTNFENRVPTLDETLAGRAHFSVLMIEAERLEWLYLAAEGHRRAAFNLTSTGWAGHWLVP